MATAEQSVPAGPIRRPLPQERKALTHKFSIAGHEGYITVCMYEDGTPGEVFVVVAREGSTIAGLLDTFAASASLSLQYGVPLAVLIEEFANERYEPSGFTKNPEIPYAKSITDYVFRWLGNKFLSKATAQVPAAPACHYCGTAMTLGGGRIYRCENCGCTTEAPPQFGLRPHSQL